jgi:hypothetical protein
MSKVVACLESFKTKTKRAALQNLRDLIVYGDDEDAYDGYEIS